MLIRRAGSRGRARRLVTRSLWLPFDENMKKCILWTRKHRKHDKLLWLRVTVVGAFRKDIQLMLQINFYIIATKTQPKNGGWLLQMRQKGSTLSRKALMWRAGSRRRPTTTLIWNPFPVAAVMTDMWWLWWLVFKRYCKGCGGSLICAHELY